MELNQNWKEAWKWASNWFTAALAAAPVLYTQWQQFQTLLPPKWFAVGMIVIGCAGILNTIRAKRKL